MVNLRQQKRCRTKGQVSIFLVFIFQVLFVFFAMIVNVGLLVYYKINLQNSVDLAAYYAAMKQAESLNTIGHINYQIRQAWKLLAFRTMILGSLGPDVHPARPLDADRLKFGPDPGEVPFTYDDVDPVTGKLFRMEPMVPIFCVTIKDIYGDMVIDPNTGTPIVNSDDNQCREADSGVDLGSFGIPNVISSLPGFNQELRKGALDLQAKFLMEFVGGGLRNYMLLANYILSFRADSLNRRKAIAVIANSLSKDTRDFIDLENNRASEGAAKVLRNNLADQNNTGLQYELYNGLGDSRCGGASPNVEEMPGWLKEIEVLALYPYQDSLYDDLDPSGNQKKRKYINIIGFGTQQSLPFAVAIKPHPALDPSYIKFLGDLNTYLDRGGIPQLPAGRWSTAVGVEKNPYCMPYVGFKASSTPKLPFMPTTLLPKLQAKAFAKPFGSRIGPWYGQTWPSRALDSFSDAGANNAKAIDPRLPPRYFKTADQLTIAQAKDIKSLPPFLPNYSRFPGDKWGLLSEGARYGYGKYFWRAGRPALNPYWTRMWREPQIEALKDNNQFNSKFFLGPQTGDPLAEAYIQDYFTPLAAVVHLPQVIEMAADMRASEIAAISPDLFDMTYYSIEPRFNRFMLPKLTEFIQKNNSRRPDLMVRGDLGWRAQGFQRAEDIASANANVETHINKFKGHEFFTKTGQQIFQNLIETKNLLTSWAEQSILNYDITTELKNKVANCTSPLADDPNLPWAPGACIKGGRTGYSVKLVSKKFLANEIPNIGGEGINNSILNLPPQDSDF